MIPRYTDTQLIEAYTRHHSTVKAAKELGVSYQTIARAAQRCGVPLTGRKYNGGDTNPQTKITNAQLLEEAKSLNCVEIAQKYGMSAERVYRRARKLGLNVDCVGGGGHYRRRQSNYGSLEYDETVTLKRVRAKFSDICQICGKPVDDKDIENGHVKRLYPTIDHIIPLSKGGTHTWNNVQLAHMSCNAGKCDRND